MPSDTILVHMNVPYFIEIIPYIVLAIILTIAVINDLRFRKIPNRLTMHALLVGIIYNSSINGWEGFYYSGKGLLLGFALLIGFYAMGGMGAGDVKLMSAVGGFLGPWGVFKAFLCTAVIGGIYALILRIMYWKSYKSEGLRDKLKRYKEMVLSFILTKSIMPESYSYKKNVGFPKLYYAVAIALGTVVSVFIKI
ncbi:MAG: prepilin peptidase [bacterium]